MRGAVRIAERWKERRTPTQDPSTEIGPEHGVRYNDPESQIFADAIALSTAGARALGPDYGTLLLAQVRPAPTPLPHSEAKGSSDWCQHPKTTEDQPGQECLVRFGCCATLLDPELLQSVPCLRSFPR